MITRCHEHQRMTAQQYSYIVYFNAITPDQMRMTDAFKNTELIGHPANGAVIIGLQRQYLHGHQLT